MLLLATGSTSETEFASNRIQFYEKNEQGYSYVVPRGCNFNLEDLNLPTLPTASSLGTGIVVEDTIILCEGATSSGVRECYEFIEGQGFQTRPASPDIPDGGHSVYVHRDGSQNAWWLAAHTTGGSENILEANFHSDSTSLDAGAWEFEQPLPEPLNVICLIKISLPIPGSPDIVFLSGVPTTTDSIRNRNWIKKIGPSPVDDSNWILLPESIIQSENRLGGHCGVLHQNSTTSGTDDSTVVVMAGGLRSSTSEFLRIPDNLLGASTTWNSYIAAPDFGMWQMGPDVGEAR